MEVSSYLGFLFSISGAILNSFALNLQKNVLSKSSNYLYNVTWWIGFLLILISEVLGILSLSLLPSFISVGLGSFTILFSVFFARNVEDITIVKLLFVLCLIVASFLNGLVTPSTKRIETYETLLNYLKSIQSILFQICLLIGSVILHYLAIIKEVKKYRLFIIAFYAAFNSSFTFIWGRCFFAQLFDVYADCEKNDCKNTLKNWLIYVSFFVTTITGFWSAGFVEQKGLKLYKQSSWISVHFVTCIIMFSSSGIIVYDDWKFFESNSKSILLISYSFLLYVFGVYGLLTY